jgi:hypothetical protein
MWFKFKENANSDDECMNCYIEYYMLVFNDMSSVTNYVICAIKIYPLIFLYWQNKLQKVKKNYYKYKRQSR